MSVWVPTYYEPIKRRRFRARSITNSKQQWQLFFNEKRYLKSRATIVWPFFVYSKMVMIQAKQ